MDLTRNTYLIFMNPLDATSKHGYRNCVYPVFFNFRRKSSRYFLFLFCITLNDSFRRNRETCWNPVRHFKITYLYRIAFCFLCNYKSPNKYRKYFDSTRTPHPQENSMNLTSNNNNCNTMFAE